MPPRDWKNISDQEAFCQMAFAKYEWMKNRQEETFLALPQEVREVFRSAKERQFVCWSGAFWNTCLGKTAHLFLFYRKERTERGDYNAERESMIDEALSADFRWGWLAGTDINTPNHLFWSEDHQFYQDKSVGHYDLYTEEPGLSRYWKDANYLHDFEKYLCPRYFEPSELNHLAMMNVLLNQGYQRNLPEAARDMLFFLEDQQDLFHRLDLAQESNALNPAVFGTRYGYGPDGSYLTYHPNVAGSLVHHFGTAKQPARMEEAFFIQAIDFMRSMLPAPHYRDR